MSDQDTTIEETAVSDETVDETGGQDLLDNTDTETETNEFDASQYEDVFGLPAGYLKGLESEEDAFEKIRSYADEKLKAGFEGYFAGGADSPADGSQQTTDSTKSSEDTKGAGEDSEYHKIRAELDEIKSHLVAERQQRQQHTLQEIERRLEAEVDSWGSKKYGTRKDRTFSQLKEYHSLRELIGTHLRGFIAEGSAPPVIEKAVRQARMFHDDTYKPSAPKKKQEPLGTPGAAKETTPGSPRNIHELYANSLK